MTGNIDILGFDLLSLILHVASQLLLDEYCISWSFVGADFEVLISADNMLHIFYAGKLRTSQGD